MFPLSVGFLLRVAALSVCSCSSTTHLRDTLLKHRISARLFLKVFGFVVHGAKGRGLGDLTQAPHHSVAEVIGS